MLALYHQTCRQCSKLITKAYSTSFSLGIRSLDKRFHDPIYGIYGFVRFADEIVDTFHHKDKKQLLDEFKYDTFKAIEQGISLNPVLHTFQEVVREYNIPYDLIESFLESMEMDLYFDTYKQEGYEKYIYGSAEVVGLMCLCVFVEGNIDEYERLKEPARKLGSAFQKVNFLRDLKDDVYERGRVYFPGVDFDSFNVDAKRAIEDDIQKDFDEAYIGIMQLPAGARRGVYLAFVYYQRLFNKIKSLTPEVIKTERVRVPNGKKLYLLMQTYLRHQLNVF